jgi:4-carboxymuconolactone decarboxylase
MPIESTADDAADLTSSAAHEKADSDAFDANSDLLELFEAGSSQRGKFSFRPMFPELVDRVIDDIYGFAYRRKGLSIDVRQLLTLAVLGTMGDCNVQLQFHLRAALNLGIPPETIREVFIQIAVLAGNVRAINACALFDEVLKAQAGAQQSDLHLPP